MEEKILKVTMRHGFRAEMTFIPKSEGGRSTPPILDRGCEYRPAIVLGDPNQRKPILRGNQIIETYIGIGFRSYQHKVEFNEPLNAELVLVHPLPIYEKTIVEGATFTIREGGFIVGFGKVTESLHIVPFP
jgi:hypothetical protein